MDAGPNVIWKYHQEEMVLTVTDEQLQRGATLKCDVNKVNVKSQSDFLIGTCSLPLLF
jgi:fumarylacetoacetate (FAA) hydrolase family protein